jgi:hypothetical protein
MKIKTSIFLILAFTAVSAFGAVPTTPDLITAWENYVKNRPDTEEFKKVGKDVYKFKSKKFDYDGTIKVIDTMIGDAKVQNKDFKSGIIQIELPGLSPEISKKVSYQDWRQNITLFMFDVENSKWLNYREYSQLTGKMLDKDMARLKPNKTNYYDLLIIALSILVLFAFIQSRKYSKSISEQYKQALQDSREHQHEVMSELRKTNELLEKLLNGSDGKSSN